MLHLYLYFFVGTDCRIAFELYVGLVLIRLTYALLVLVQNMLF